MGFAFFFGSTIEFLVPRANVTIWVTWKQNTSFAMRVCWTILRGYKLLHKKCTTMYESIHKNLAMTEWMPNLCIFWTTRRQNNTSQEWFAYYAVLLSTFHRWYESMDQPQDATNIFPNIRTYIMVMAAGENWSYHKDKSSGWLWQQVIKVISSSARMLLQANHPIDF